MMGVYGVSWGSGCGPESWTAANSPTRRQASYTAGSSPPSWPIYSCIMCWMNGSSARYSPAVCAQRWGDPGLLPLAAARLSAVGAAGACADPRGPALQDAHGVARPVSGRPDRAGRGGPLWVALMHPRREGRSPAQMASKGKGTLGGWSAGNAVAS